MATLPKQVVLNSFWHKLYFVFITHLWEKLEHYSVAGHLSERQDTLWYECQHAMGDIDINFLSGYIIS